MKIIDKLSVVVRFSVFLLNNIFHKLFKRPLPNLKGLRVLKDVSVPMRDGTHLMVNIYQPDRPDRYPVIMCMTPYGKDQQPEHYTILKIFGQDVGFIKTSQYAIFEGPDPAFWVSKGYIVIHANARGMWNSEGEAFVFDQQNGIDYYDLIEWAAIQSWGNGKVGLNGVSYLAWSQWMAASFQPPHLGAICPWEGFTDLYRDAAYHGGIREIGLIGQITKRRFNAHYNRKYGIREDFLKISGEHPLDDEYWLSKRPDLSKITVPSLVCASWSDQGLHTRGSFEGYKKIQSKQKWLYTHGRKKWETYYSQEVLEFQEKFFNHFLKGDKNDMLDQPFVRLEVRTSYYKSILRYEKEWPISSIIHQPLFLHASQSRLLYSLPKEESFIQYDSLGKKRGNQAVFTHQFQQETELTGGMKLKLWVATKETNDMDLFIAVKKLDKQGQEIYFSGYNSNPHDMVAKGWLRISHRQLDPVLSNIEMPFHPHKQILKTEPNQIVPVEIEILPSSTLFEKDSYLQLVVMGQEPIEYNTLKHESLVNKGFHRIYTGGIYDSWLVIPKAIPTI
jgi:predicted acyl esterase